MAQRPSVVMVEDSLNLLIGDTQFITEVARQGSAKIVVPEAGHPKLSPDLIPPDPQTMLREWLSRVDAGEDILALVKPIKFIANGKPCVQPLHRLPRNGNLVILSVLGLTFIPAAALAIRRDGPHACRAGFDLAATSQEFKPD
jgi:hypothetical protein